ncbi:hypothetical protein GCM10010207_52880 [Streptomyces atratus]|nr:hypothetical protein GCM10010207_52880 [Streptomyces atratus]
MIDGGSGRVIDKRFEPVERLGSSGMGTVRRARDLVLHREVAVEQVCPLTAEPAPESSAASRVPREARTPARLSHRRMVTLHHVIDEGEGSYPWLLMEPVPGRSLAELLDEPGRRSCARYCSGPPRQSPSEGRHRSFGGDSSLTCLATCPPAPLRE